MKKFYIILVAIVLVGAVALSTLGSRDAQQLQGGFMGWLAPFLETGDAVSRQISSMGQSLKTLDQLEEENAKLLLQVRELRATNQLLRDMESENNKLRAALDYRERSVFHLLPARVISRDASTWWNIVTINRGFEDGIESDMPVLTEVGLVGKTTTVSKNTAKVVLISDESCRVAARVEGTPEQGIASGFRPADRQTEGALQLAFLPKKANLQPGQKVYSAGVSGAVFPSGILIGTVESFRARALDGQAILTPAVDLSTIEDVFVLIGTK
ncbi:MAG: hypothetical protein Fur0032_10860 [Terrimicrobiaceae bacterium]